MSKSEPMRPELMPFWVRFPYSTTFWGDLTSAEVAIDCPDIHPWESMVFRKDHYFWKIYYIARVVSYFHSFQFII